MASKGSTREAEDHIKSNRGGAPGAAGSSSGSIPVPSGVPKMAAGVGEPVVHKSCECRLSCIRGGGTCQQANSSLPVEEELEGTVEQNGRICRITWVWASPKPLHNRRMRMRIRFVVLCCARVANQGRASVRLLERRWIGTISWILASDGEYCVNLASVGESTQRSFVPLWTTTRPRATLQTGCKVRGRNDRETWRAP